MYSKNASSSTPAFSPVTNYYYVNPRRVFFNPHKKEELWVASGGYGTSRGIEGNAPVVREAAVPRPESAPLFRYDGTKKLLTLRFAPDGPVRGDLTLSSIDGRNIRRLMSGRVFTRGSRELFFPLAAMTPGLYLVSLSTYKLNYFSRILLL